MMNFKESVFPQGYTYPYPAGTTRQPTFPAPQFSPVGRVVAILTIASTLFIRSSMVDLQTRGMILTEAINNGIAQSTAD